MQTRSHGETGESEALTWSTFNSEVIFVQRLKLKLGFRFVRSRNLYSLTAFGRSSEPTRPKSASCFTMRLASCSWQGTKRTKYSFTRRRMNRCRVALEEEKAELCKWGLGARVEGTWSYNNVFETIISRQGSRNNMQVTWRGLGVRTCGIWIGLRVPRGKTSEYLRGGAQLPVSQ